jgi:hypothetical protein
MCSLSVIASLMGCDIVARYILDYKPILLGRESIWFYGIIMPLFSESIMFSLERRQHVCNH